MKKLFTIILTNLVILISGINAQNNEFVYIKDGKFM
jgi:hypothetical protein